MQVQEQTNQFGHGMLKHFQLDPSYNNINTGSFGITPRVVTHAQLEYIRKFEENPDKWIRVDLENHIKQTRQIASQYVNSPNENNIVLVENAADAFNSVIKSQKIFNWQKGDVILTSSIQYKMVDNTISHLQITFPFIQHLKVKLTKQNIQSQQLIIEAYKNAILDAQKQGMNVKVAVLDHISSNPAILFPIKELSQMLHSFGIIVIVDAAHACGQIPIDLADLDVDFYFSNFHKWGYVAKTVTFLYINDKYISKTYPSVISLYYGEGHLREFFWVGSRDYSSQLTIPDALNFRKKLGEKNYCHSLVLQVKDCISELWKTQPLVQNEQLVGSMINIELPCKDKGLCQQISKKMQMEDNLTFPIIEFDGIQYVRFSCQIINELSDFIKAANRFSQHMTQHYKNQSQSQQIAPKL